MQIQATYKRSEDSLKLLDSLGRIEELQHGNVRIMFNNRSPEDQKLLKHLLASLGNSKWRLTPETLWATGIAAVSSIGFMVYGVAGLLGYM